MNTSTSICERVAALRDWLSRHGYSALIVPTLDPHNSEYVPAHWQAREWLTGFTGSAGTAIVTATNAALWTDSRYFLQAEEQLAGTPFCLMREGEPGTPTLRQWLDQEVEEEAHEGRAVAFVGDMMTDALFEEIFPYNAPVPRTAMADEDPFDALWTDRPPLPQGRVELMPEEVAGASAAGKLQALRKWMGDMDYDLDYYMMNDLSEIAWMLNLRGCDVPYNPFFVGFLIVSRHTKESWLCVGKQRLAPEALAHLRSLYVNVLPYDAWGHVLQQTVGDVQRVGMPSGMARHVTMFCIEEEVMARTIDSPVEEWRAVKNEVEQAGFRRAMERDGVALVRFLRWLELAVPAGAETEVSVDEKLTALRAQQPGFRSLSFPTIAGYGPHGAIVHYEAEPDTCATLRPEGLILLDSGAHYEDGTTDITRTIALGTLTDEERRVYTLVLKGHVALARMRFPAGTTGLQLDTAARMAMWREGYDFGHGTGHGVGHRLGVHEGPAQIRKNVRACTLIPFCSGQTITDEPGVYVPGRFGVRIENVLLVRPYAETPFGQFLEFETLTLCPYDTRPIVRELLGDEDAAWINRYHEEVCRRLMPLLDDEADRTWLRQATRPI